MTDDDMHPTVTLYRRPGCHLCDTAEELLDDALGAVFENGPRPGIELVDVSTSAQLEAAYGQRLPVISAGGAEIELVTSGGAIRRLLRQAFVPADAS